MWEMALAVCKELERQYEEEVLDYTQLSELLRRRARFYDCIMKQVRPEPEYFRVAYYGRGFPAFLQNKVSTVIAHLLENSIEHSHSSHSLYLYYRYLCIVGRNMSA